MIYFHCKTTFLCQLWKSYQKYFYCQLVVLHPLPAKIEGYESPSKEQSCEFSIAYESLSDAIIFCDSHRKECKGIHDGTCSKGHWFACMHTKRVQPSNSSGCTFLRKGT